MPKWYRQATVVSCPNKKSTAGLQYIPRQSEVAPLLKQIMSPNFTMRQCSSLRRKNYLSDETWEKHGESETFCKQRINKWKYSISLLHIFSMIVYRGKNGGNSTARNGRVWRTSTTISSLSCSCVSPNFIYMYNMTRSNKMRQSVTVSCYISPCVSVPGYLGLFFSLTCSPSFLQLASNMYTLR